ncbi:glycosyltransferase [Rubellicoccus peritrichatus]|uniref:Glycosyltransferase n=1 Tax=Rubellicoccus peritrichatus TaxID=3080537 RepID=A0AAQ3QV04_9BACT|nr:glycosyltransferase [Puniceicoccus sp. CR14]WOO42961.1 glycosyltransferase [Puniceicoccus sp. CR14]
MNDLIIIIPAYNEQERIRATLESYAGFFAKQSRYAWSILVVLNNCSDNTRDEVDLVAKKEPRVRFLEFENPIGKGGAIIEGLHSAKNAKLIGFTDADGATPPNSFYELVEATEHYDIAVASRWLPESRILKAQSRKRRIFSRIFNVLVNIFFQLGMKDTQCGAKVFRSEVIKHNLEDLVIADMAFDVNLLFIIHKKGGKIIEIPTTWEDKAGSSVRLTRTSLSMGLSLIRLRWIYSPLRPLRKYFMPIETYIYRKLK